MGNIQCSKCRLPAAIYDYDPNKMKKMDYKVPSELERQDPPRSHYYHDWVDHWKDKSWYDIMFPCFLLLVKN